MLYIKLIGSILLYVLLLKYCEKIICLGGFVLNYNGIQAKLVVVANTKPSGNFKG